jgi:hypothetical protein
MAQRNDNGPTEYTLTVHRAYRRDRRQECIRFHFQSSAEFHHFRYSIGTEHSVRERAITIRLRGLSTSGLTMPETGRAEGIVDLFGLEGAYSVRVIKQGNVATTFQLKVDATSLAVPAPDDHQPTFLAVRTM